MKDFDLIVLGGGSGGLAGAFRAAEHGARVALLEPGELGGTCVNRGCVPKKAMWLVADLAHRIDLAARLGFDTASPRLDWASLLTERQRYIDNIHASYRRRLDASGVVLVSMRGRLRDAHTVECEDGSRLQAKHLLLATGSHPKRPDVPGAKWAGVSDDFFTFTEAPERVALVGGGYIAVELAGMLKALGSSVDLFVRGERMLSHADAELVESLQAGYRQQGIGLSMGYRLAGIERDDGALRLRDASGDLSDRYEQVILAIGRSPNTRGIGLEEAGVALDDGGNVIVDACQRTSLPHVMAVGDMTGKVTLTPVAIAAARRAMDRVFGGQANAKLDYEDIPTVIFSHPPLAAVGLTEAQAHERFEGDVSVYRADFRPMLHALADSPQRSLFKLICTGEQQRVVGLHMLGEGVDEILQGFAVALKKGITLADLQDTVAIHPTSAEEVVLLR